MQNSSTSSVCIVKFGRRFGRDYLVEGRWGKIGSGKVAGMVSCQVSYTIFETEWGYFAIASAGQAVLRTHLPIADERKVKANLLAGLGKCQYRKGLFRPIQKKVISYFAGRHVEFDRRIPLALDGFSRFARLTLCACREVGFGATVSYGQLAVMIGRGKAFRAVGSVLAKNPVPLIIPCHRVIRSGGRLGGFSAAGGTGFKKKMLCNEQPGSAQKRK